MDGQYIDFDPDIESVQNMDIIAQQFIDGSLGAAKLICVGKNKFRILDNNANHFITGYKLLMHSWKII